jgi:predicted phage terminase large subunit-like protein
MISPIDEKLVDRQLGRKSLLQFIHLLHHDYKSNWFHEMLCRELESFYYQTEAGQSPHLLIMAPPRHGKSEIVSRYFPAWALGHNPDTNIIACSYSDDLSSRINRDVQRIMESPKYENIFPETPIGNKRVVSLSGIPLRNSSIFEVAGRRGSYRSSGVGGGITGMGYDIGIIDDYIKNSEEAHSQVVREKIDDWFKSTFYTRRSTKSGIAIIATRWHFDDLIGRLVDREKDKWRVIKFRAIASEDDQYRKEGEALHPERYPIEQLLDFKKALGSRMFDALYQQSPSIEGGSIVKRGWIKYYRELPGHFNETIMSWDMAFKESEHSDYVVGQLWGRRGAEFYLIDMVRDRMDFPTTIRAMRQFCLKHPKAHAKLVEDKANGQAVIDSLKTEIFGIIPFSPKDSKDSRFNSVAPAFEAGNVYLPENAPWLDLYIEELTGFPFMPHDDCVDATSQALIFMREHISQGSFGLHVILRK